MAQVGWSSGVTLVWSSRSLWLFSLCSCLCSAHADLLVHVCNPHQCMGFLLAVQAEEEWLLAQGLGHWVLVQEVGHWVLEHFLPVSELHPRSGLVTSSGLSKLLASRSSVQCPPACFIHICTPPCIGGPGYSLALQVSKVFAWYRARPQRLWNFGTNPMSHFYLL